jgi:hypothetical protein
MRKEQEVQYIWHDGVRIREDQLVNMAMGAGSYALAEHYVCSLLAHGCAYGLAYLINKANEIREYYQVRKYPVPSMDEDRVTPFTKCHVSIEDQVRKKYLHMSPNERIELLSACLSSLRVNYPKLFRFKNQWQAIYLVMRDRLDYGLLQCNFLSIAISATPDDWPINLQINENVIKNFGRVMVISDDEAYYELKYNPMGDLCDTFWNIIKCEIIGNEA